MLSSCYAVGIVVDPDFGDRLVPLASRLHVWIVDTPPNRAAAERVWAADAAYSLERGVTTFRVDEGATREEWCIAVLPDVHDHHGAHAHDPPYGAIEVYGAAPSAALRAAFAEWGLAGIEEVPGGFRAASLPVG
jgi:hypothetical protein